MHVFVIIYCYFCDSFSQKVTFFNLFITFINFISELPVLFYLFYSEAETDFHIFYNTHKLPVVVIILCFNTSRQTFADNCNKKQLVSHSQSLYILTL